MFDDLEPPLTTRQCGDYMGFGAEWIRAAIVDGVTHRGELVKLEAETLHLNGRTVYRIQLDCFVTFLRAIGWQRLPRRSAFPK